MPRAPISRTSSFSSCHEASLRKMKRWVLWVFLLWLVCLQGAIGFSCVCSPSECDEITDEDCPGGGTVWDPCGCCRVCARVEAEPCGGPYGFHGTCGPGLECVVAAAASGKPVLAANSEGICVRKYFTFYLTHSQGRVILRTKRSIAPPTRRAHKPKIS